MTEPDTRAASLRLLARELRGLARQRRMLQRLICIVRSALTSLDRAR